MRVSAKQEKRFDQITNRFIITKQLPALVRSVVDSEMDANDIAEAFGAAGVIVHPVMIQNLLARRAQQKT